MNDKSLPKHWYFITVYFCPQCGVSDEVRERRFDERPDDPWKRHEYIEAWNGCD